MEQAWLANQLLNHGNELAEFLGRRLPTRYQGQVATEDVVQDVWESVFRAAQDSIPDNPQQFRNWLLTVARRQLIDSLKAARALKRGGGNVLAQQLRSAESSLLDLFNIVAAPQLTPSGEISSREVVNSIRRALAVLPEKRRIAMWMFHIEGLPQAEIARYMSKTVPAVAKLLTEGRKQLRRELALASSFFHLQSLRDTAASNEADRKPKLLKSARRGGKKDIE